MANVYTSSYTGEQVDAAVAGVNNLISGSTPVAKATADANGNNIPNTYAKQTGTYPNMTVGNATNADSATKATQDGDGNNIAETYLPIINKTLPSLSNNNVTSTTIQEFVQSFNLKYGEGTKAMYFENGNSYSTIRGFLDKIGVIYKQYNYLSVLRVDSNAWIVTVYAGYNNQVQMTIPPQYFFVTQSGASPATSNYALKSEVVKLSATNNVSTNKEEWGIGADSGAGTYLIGTFKIYDTNIHLRVTGSLGNNTDTDIDILIKCTNYKVNTAVCYANSLYTSSALTGVYYTLDNAHNLRIYIASPNYGKFFVSASVVGGTIVDKGSSSKQSPSNGFYISTKYYLSLDPTKLTPSTENGWTEGGGDLVPPTAGKYFISIIHGTNSGFGEITYNGTLGYGYATFGALTVRVPYGVYITSAGTYITSPSGESGQPDTVYYKKQ